MDDTGDDTGELTLPVETTAQAETAGAVETAASGGSANGIEDINSNQESTEMQNQSGGRTARPTGTQTAAAKAAEPTAEIPGNQAKVAKSGAPPAPETMDERMNRRSADLHLLMREKEALTLTFIHGHVPSPYYRRWKKEGNDIFTMLVSLKHRQRTARRRGA